MAQWQARPYGYQPGVGGGGPARLQGKGLHQSSLPRVHDAPLPAPSVHCERCDAPVIIAPFFAHGLQHARACLMVCVPVRAQVGGAGFMRMVEAQRASRRRGYALPQSLACA